MTFGHVATVYLAPETGPSRRSNDPKRNLIAVPRRSDSQRIAASRSRERSFGPAIES